MKLRENEKLIKEISKLSHKLEKVQNLAEKQKKNIDNLNYKLEKKNEELAIINERLEFCRSHRRAPDIEELKAYTYKEEEVSKRLRRKNVSE
jgi:hypothetical protein